MRTVIVLSALSETTLPRRTLGAPGPCSAGGVPSPPGLAALGLLAWRAGAVRAAAFWRRSSARSSGVAGRRVPRRLRGGDLALLGRGGRGLRSGRGGGLGGGGCLGRRLLGRGLLGDGLLGAALGAASSPAAGASSAAASGAASSVAAASGAASSAAASGAAVSGSVVSGFS